MAKYELLVIARKGNKILAIWYLSLTFDNCSTFKKIIIKNYKKGKNYYNKNISWK